MNYRHALLAITLSCGVGACASSPDYGLRYEDGSYYSPANEGRGDYYVGADYQRSYYLYDDYDLFFGSGYGGWYGSPFYSYGGYCSVRYRYCPRWAWGSGFGSPYRETGFQLYFGSPWDPYWGWGHYPSQPYRGIRRPSRPGESTRIDPRSDRVPVEQGQPFPSPRPDEARRPRPRPDWVSDEDSDAFPFPASGSNRRVAPRRPAPPPAPDRRPTTDSDGN